MRSRSFTRLALAGLLVTFAAGCSKKIDSTFVPNLAPEVRLTAAPINSQGRYFYAYRMDWVGYDPDGRVDHYLFATLNPDSVDVALARLERQGDHADSIWQSTNKNEEIVMFRASSPDTDLVGISTDYHTFAVVAVDNQGMLSKPKWRSFNAFTQAPTTLIENPRPSSATAVVTPAMRIHWGGADPDGQLHAKPLYYRYRLFSSREKDFPNVADVVQLILDDTRILRWKYAPKFTATDSCPVCGWDSASVDHPDRQYVDLIPNSVYLFAVTGFDEAGAYDPVFSRASNLLKFAVSYAGTLGPTLCMSNDFFNFCYGSGGYFTSPSRYVNIEVPADQEVVFNWFAFAPEGADIQSYRWVMDLQDLTDNTPRTDEEKDWKHWSASSLTTTTAHIGPFVNNGEEHLFFIEAEDNNGLKSLGIIRFTVVRATFEKELLFVDDTRLAPDQFDYKGDLYYPSGSWPTSAELDTFFFAKGGVPWKGYPGYGTPDATLSPPGLFYGFEFDTVGTKGILSGILPLSKLGLYKTVVWYTDGSSAFGSTPPDDPISPTTSLRLMSSPGHPSTVALYLKQGGRMWLFGGGVGIATTQPYNKRNTPSDEFTNIDNELIPGRLMYDFVHWQSAMSLYSASQYCLLNIPDFAPPWPNAAPGRGWTNQGMTRDLSQPDYNKLKDFVTGAAFLLPRNPGTDPPSPVRDYGTQAYPPSTLFEYMGTLTNLPPNFIHEDADPSPDGVRIESTLDTLYYSIGVGLQRVRPTDPEPGAPTMTYYHGFDTPQLVYSGWPLWFFSRQQTYVLADFVLRDIFGLNRSVTPAPAAPAHSRTATAPAAGRPMPGRMAAAPARR